MKIINHFNKMQPNLSKMILLLISITATFSSQAEQRIISAGSTITELFVALEATEQLVAVDLSSRSLIDSDKIKQVGYHRQLSAEGLMALNPSQLIGSNEMGPDTTLQLLQASQVEITEAPSGNTVEDLYKRIELIAQITNSQKNVSPLIKQVDSAVSVLKDNQPATKPNVLFLMVSADRPATVAGKDTPVDTIIKLAGGNNPASESIDSYKPLSYEAIITLQPDVILISQRAWDQLRGKEGILGQFPLLAATPAGQHGNLLPISSTAIIGGFGLESIELAKQLNQLFTEK